MERAIGQLNNATAITQLRYDRLAPFYDLKTWLAEQFLFKKFRALLWSCVRARSILEQGVGTGANTPYYPKTSKVTAVDLGEQMLNQAKHRAEKLGIVIDLWLMDAQNLTFPDESFDTVVTTWFSAQCLSLCKECASWGEL